MTDPRAARVWFAATALLALLAVTLQLPGAAAETGGYFTEPWHKVLNVFAYFTIQSNLLVGVTSLLLAIRPDRPSTMFRVLRLTGVLAITVTGVVFHLLLAHLVEPTGVGAFTNLLTHTAVPVLAVLGWLLFGPRGTTWPVVGLTLLLPLAWFAFTLVRGAAVGGFYPYPFLDVDELGLAQVLLNGLGIAGAWVALAVVARLADRALTSGRVYAGLHQD